MAELECLFSPEGVTQPPLNVVFVHGLGGSASSTWMANGADAATLWPAWVGEDLKCATWVLEYDAGVSQWVGDAMPLQSQAVSVLDALSSERGLKGPIVLVGHSLGGLVIKTAAVYAGTTGIERYESVLDRIKAIVFVATPHFGSQLANIARASKAILRINDQVGDLARHNPQLQTLNTQFRALHEKRAFRVRTFGETRGVFVGIRVMGFQIGKPIVVVSADSSDPHVAGDALIPLEEDHISICKPRDRKAQIHKSLVEFLTTLTRASELPPPNDTDFPEAVEKEGASPLSAAPPGELTGPDDRRLQPREGRVYGRQAEIDVVLSFLKRTDDPGSIAAHVTAFGGVGKTEVCKAALRLWLSNCGGHAYFVEVPDGATAAELPLRIGRALGKDNVATLDELQAILRPGLYYVDNIEDVATRPTAQQSFAHSLGDQASGCSRPPAWRSRACSVDRSKLESCLRWRQKTSFETSGQGPSRFRRPPQGMTRFFGSCETISAAIH